MSTSTSSTIDTDCSLLSLRDFVELMSMIGWWPRNPAMHLSPGGDKYDWNFSYTSELQNILDQLDRRKTFGGIVLWKHGGEESGDFVIDWISNRIEILWGAGCPKNENWPRAIDSAWIMSELHEISHLLSISPLRIELCIYSP